MIDGSFRVDLDNYFDSVEKVVLQSRIKTRTPRFTSWFIVDDEEAEVVVFLDVVK